MTITPIAIGLGSDPTYPFVSTPTMQNSWSMGSYSENTLMLHDNDPDRAQSLQLGAVLPPGIPEQYFFYSMFHGTNNSGATYTTDFGFGGAFDFRLRYLAPGGPGYLVGDLGGIANNYFTMGLDSWEHYGDVSASQEYAVLTSSSEYDPVMDTFYDEFARIDQTVQVPQGATAIRLDASFSGYSDWYCTLGNQSLYWSHLDPQHREPGWNTYEFPLLEGTTGELRLGFEVSAAAEEGGTLMLDNIAFIPEPSAVWITATLLLGLLRKTRHPERRN